MYEWLVGGWNRIILGGVQELIDQRVIEGEGIVVDEWAWTARRHVAFISDSTVHIVTPRVIWSASSCCANVRSAR